MLEHFKMIFKNSPSQSELEKRNKSLIYKNSELVKTIEELRLKISEMENSLPVAEVNHSEKYFDPLTSRIVVLDENEELKKINKITSQYYPVPMEEDDDNIVIRYYQYDQSSGKITKNFTPWKERITINGERYYLIIQSHEDKQTWEISLKRYFQAAMPPVYKLKAVTDKGEEFENNEAIVTCDTQSISLLIELEEGEGLKFEIYPEPDDYVASRIFWFY